MIDRSLLVWFAAGLAAGLLHAAMLWRAAGRLTAWTPLLSMLRLAGVAAVLVAAAVSGAIIAAGAGWAVGIAALGGWFFARRNSKFVAAPDVPTHE